MDEEERLEQASDLLYEAIELLEAFDTQETRSLIKRMNNWLDD